MTKISTDDYNVFNQKGGSYKGGPGRHEADHQPDVHLSDFVTNDNCQRALKLKGLTYSATKADIAEFFGLFNVKESDVIIDMHRGRPTGYALVFLENKDDAAQALKDLNHKYIGNRYVDIFFPTVKK